MTGGPVRERVTAVLADGRQGSGYLLTPYLVLTAGHVVRGALDIRAVVPGNSGEVPCGVLWPLRPGVDLDVALLVAREDLVPAGGFPAMRWAKQDGLSPVPGCQSIGFPAVQRMGRRLDTEQLTGTFKPGSGLLGKAPVLAVDGTPPAPHPDGGSPWAGMSGAAVFADGLLLGVISADPAGWQHGRVTLVPAARLLDDPRFMGALLGADCPQPVPVSPAPSPDAAFEARYTRYLASKYGTLTIFGVDVSDHSRAAWPLDAAYLSLEADEREQHRHGEAHRPGPAAPIPADQALAGHDRVLLRGVAGSGKTTLVQWLAVTAALQEFDRPMRHLQDRIPFVLPLRTLVRQGQLPLPDGFLTAVRSPLAGAQPSGWAERVLDRRRGLLLIDGIDEIAEPDRERVRRWLRDLLAAYPGNLWLVTSRPSAVADSWLAAEGFTELTLSPMSRDDIASFINRWHDAARTTCTDPEERDRLDGYQQTLLMAVRTKQDLGRLATNPLMCGLICALHRDRRGYLPHGRKELYDAALSMLLVRRDRERDIEVRLTEEPQIQLLQKLAYWLIKNGQAEMDQADAIDLIDAALPAMPGVSAQGDAERIFRYLLLRSGLLREPADGAVDFIHRTFQDYLGAKAAVEERDFDLMAKNAHHDQWEDVIRMAVAHARPAERARLLRKLIARGDLRKTYRTRLHLLATACLELATELDPAIRAEVESRAATHIPPQDVDEARALADIGPVVLDLLPGPEGLTDQQAQAVVVTASRIGTDTAIPLLSRFRDHPALAVRAQLAWTWDRFDTDLYFNEVVSHLRPDKLYFTAQSQEHLRLLGQLSGAEMIQVIGEFSAHDIATALGGDTVTSLDLRQNSVICEAEPLCEGFPRLVHLTFWTSGQQSLEWMRGLPDLTSLRLFIVGSLHDSLPLPGALPVTRLEVLTFADLRNIVTWPRLRHVMVLNDLMVPDRWKCLADSSVLRSLKVLGSYPSSLLSTQMSFPHITELELTAPTTEMALPDFSRLFPALQLLSLTTSQDEGPTFDSSSLTGLPHLREIRLCGKDISLSTDGLRPGIKVVRVSPSTGSVSRWEAL